MEDDVLGVEFEPRLADGVEKESGKKVLKLKTLFYAYLCVGMRVCVP